MHLSLHHFSPIFYADILCSLLDSIGKMKFVSALNTFRASEHFYLIQNNLFPYNNGLATFFVVSLYYSYNTNIKIY